MSGSSAKRRTARVSRYAWPIVLISACVADPPAAFSEVRGHVVRLSDGAPIADAKVVVDRFGWPGYYRTDTDGNGDFVLRVPAGARADIRIGARGFARLTAGGVFAGQNVGSWPLTALSEQLTAESIGIGASIKTADGRILISAIHVETGLRVGDEVVSADAYDLRGMPVDLAATFLRGRPAEPARLVILRDGHLLTLEVRRVRYGTNDPPHPDVVPLATQPRPTGP